MNILKWLWQPSHYWPLWLFGSVLSVFGIREFWALSVNRPQDTFSDWVWHALKIHPGESIGQWSFVDYAWFALYVSVFIWLAYHFFWHKFT